jgi:hypothetical protein
MMPVRGDIVRTLSGCVEYDEGWNWSEVSVGRVGEIIDGPSYAGWVRLRWEDGSESANIALIPMENRHRPTLMNLSGEECRLIAAGPAAAAELAQLRAEHSELGEAAEAAEALEALAALDAAHERERQQLEEKHRGEMATLRRATVVDTEVSVRSAGRHNRRSPGGYRGRGYMRSTLASRGRQE